MVEEVTFGEADESRRQEVCLNHMDQLFLGMKWIR